MRNRKIFLNLAAGFCSIISFLNVSHSQFTFNQGQTVIQIVDSMLFNDQGAVSNVSFNGSSINANNSQNCVFPFTYTGTIFPFNEGVFLTSSNAPSVNLDPDLSALQDVYPVTNGAIVEFDFVAESDSFAFTYVFASSEYQNYTCSSFNDVFGFFLSGPGINGPFTNNAVNLATIPGTNTPVAINTLNSGFPANNSICLAANPLYMTHSIYYTVSYNAEFQANQISFNGATVALIAAYGLIPGETYHIKLAVANVGDQSLPSGVFIEKTLFDVIGDPCTPVDIDPDVAVGYGWNSLVAPTEQGNLLLNLCNYACQNVTDALVSIQMPNEFVPDTSGLSNPIFASNILTFALNDFQNCETLIIPFSFPGATPAGTQICFPVEISADADTDLSNNYDTICGIVLNSYDPNMKFVNQPFELDPEIKERFIYQVFFQNDGNFPALNVVISDTMHGNLDLSTFKFLGSSHPSICDVDSTTREIIFSFENINLESSEVDLNASQGYIIYEIQENVGLAHGDSITNTAYIYFDFNEPIVTNTSVNVNQSSVGLEQLYVRPISMYPNPASTNIKFSGTAVQKVVIYDVLGQVVLTRNITNNTLSLSGLTNGVYFVEMHTEAGLQTQRLVVSR